MNKNMILIKNQVRYQHQYLDKVYQVYNYIK
jgi:hypothetical protein